MTVVIDNKDGSDWKGNRGRLRKSPAYFAFSWRH